MGIFVKEMLYLLKKFKFRNSINYFLEEDFEVLNKFKDEYKNLIDY